MWFRHNTPQVKRGFTLVELLVVISIIGFLSSTIIASINTARDKGDNAYKIRMIEEYRNGLELAHSELNGYPWDQNIGAPQYISGIVCLGTTDCSESQSPPISSTINSKLAPYIKIQPAFDLLISEPDDLSFPSPLYQCYSIRTSDKNFCDAAYLYYALKGSGARCGLGAQEFHISEVTECILRIN